MNNKTEVVYVGENCGEMTREDVIGDIKLWLAHEDCFDHLDVPTEDLIEVIYTQLLDQLTWQAPYTLLLEYDEDDIETIINKVEGDGFSGSK